MAPAPKYTSQEQQTLILEAAAKCIQKASLLDFTMSAISKEAGLSMGSIYKHIQSKEDVLVALGYHSQVHFKQLVHKVFDLPLPAVAKIVAVQLVDHDQVSPYAFGPELETLLANEAILQRASQRWLEKFIEIEFAVEDLFLGQVVKACDSGELVTKPTEQDDMVHEIITSLWSICVGNTQVTMQRSARQILQPGRSKHIQRDSHSPIIRALMRLMNTYPWQTMLTDELIEQTCDLLQQNGMRQTV